MNEQAQEAAGQGISMLDAATAHEVASDEARPAGVLGESPPLQSNSSLAELGAEAQADIAAYRAASEAHARKHQSMQIASLVLASLATDLNANLAVIADRAHDAAEALLARYER